MGCDIHLVLEYKDKQGNWQAYNGFSSEEDGRPTLENVYTGGRNYNLFAALCGVKSHCFANPPEPCYHYIGVPSNASEIYKQLVDMYGTDGHSHSATPYIALLGYDWEDWGETCNEFIDEMFPIMEKLSLEYGKPNIRIVYFFDN